MLSVCTLNRSRRGCPRRRRPRCSRCPPCESWALKKCKSWNQFCSPLSSCYFLLTITGYAILWYYRKWWAIRFIQPSQIRYPYQHQCQAAETLWAATFSLARLIGSSHLILFYESWCNRMIDDDNNPRLLQTQGRWSLEGQGVIGFLIWSPYPLPPIFGLYRD